MRFQKRLKVAVYRSLVMVAVDPSWFGNQKGPMIPLALKMHHAVTFWLWIGFSITISGHSVAQILQSWVFT